MAKRRTKNGKMNRMANEREREENGLNDQKAKEVGK